MNGDSDAFGNLTFRDLIAHQSAARRDQPFVVHEDAAGVVSELAYADLEGSTNAFANTLLARGLEPGDRVLILMANSIPFVVAMLGCAKAGLIAVPVNTGYVAPEVAHVIELVEPAAFVAGRPFVELLAEADNRERFRAGCVVGEPEIDRAAVAAEQLTWEEMLAGDPSLPDCRVDGEDVLQLIMTSGTTARPKAVMRTHVNCLWSRIPVRDAGAAHARRPQPDGAAGLPRQLSRPDPVLVARLRRDGDPARALPGDPVHGAGAPASRNRDLARADANQNDPRPTSVTCRPRALRTARDRRAPAHPRGARHLRDAASGSPSRSSAATGSPKPRPT